MSGGGGGRILIKRIADTPEVSEPDRQELLAIFDRTIVRCSWSDWRRVKAILKKYLRP